MKFTVDRIEDGIIVLLLRVDESVKVELPKVVAPTLREGDVVDLTITKDELETNAAKQRVSSLIEKLKNKQK
ncbi:MAG: DUF3006 domain-containing protein [bacterium]